MFFHNELLTLRKKGQLAVLFAYGTGHYLRTWTTRPARADRERERARTHAHTPGATGLARSAGRSTAHHPCSQIVTRKARDRVHALRAVRSSCRQEGHPPAGSLQRGRRHHLAIMRVRDPTRALTRARPATAAKHELARGYAAHHAPRCVPPRRVPVAM